MAGFDYDVVVVGSGFGGSVAALRAAEKGYRVAVMVSGRRWRDEDIPKSQWDLAHFVWFLTRTHQEWERDRERIHIMPASVTITSGTWPDPVTSIEPTYWGLGSNVFAFLGTYHQHGEQKHSFESWLKEILKHPSEEILPADPRHWSERSFGRHPQNLWLRTTAHLEPGDMNASLLAVKQPSPAGDVLNRESRLASPGMCSARHTVPAGCLAPRTTTPNTHGRNRHASGRGPTISARISSTGSPRRPPRGGCCPDSPRRLERRHPCRTLWPM